MTIASLIAPFLERHLGFAVGEHEIELTELTGGLEASSVVLVTAKTRGAMGEPFRFVVKRISGHARREAAIYRHLSRHGSQLPARPFWIDDAVEHSAALYLEALSCPAAWPWSRLETARLVLDEVAVLHASHRHDRGAALPAWDYDADLCRRAESLCATLEGLPRGGELHALRAALPIVRRLLIDIPRWRAHLLDLAPLGQTLIHGDLHTANVLFREGRTGARPVLIDWGRARAGSPLEDVSSWLQSLGYWESGAKLKHDTLLKGYLAPFGVGLSEDVRTAYWLAGASNALAGALHYHVACALAAKDGPTRDAALAAASDWIRILRRADIRWRALGQDRQ